MGESVRTCPYCGEWKFYLDATCKSWACIVAHIRARVARAFDLQDRETAWQEREP